MNDDRQPEPRPGSIPEADPVEDQLRRLASRSVGASATSVTSANRSAPGGAIAPPPRRAAPLLAAAAVVTVLLLGAAAIATRDDGGRDTGVDVGGPSGSAASTGTLLDRDAVRTDTSIGSAGGPADEPGAGPIAEPPPDEGPVTVWLDSRRYPRSGADLVAIYRSADGEEVMFGVGMGLERWDGTGWQPAGGASFCTDFWGCTGRLFPPGDAMAVRDIGIPTQGLGVPTGSAASSPLFLRLEGLDVGWYRFRATGSGDGTPGQRPEVEATGTFEVVDGPVPDVVPYEVGTAGSLQVQPALVEPGRHVLQVTSVAPVGPGGGSSAADLDAFERLLGTEVTIQRRVDGRWSTIAELPSISLSSRQWTVAVADVDLLEPGAYRVARRSTTGGIEVAGHVWVTA